MRYAWTIALLGAAALLAFLLCTSPNNHANDAANRYVAPDYTAWDPPQKYAAFADRQLRAQYTDLAEALRKTRGSVKRDAWVKLADENTRIAQRGLTEPVPHGADTTHREFAAAMKAWASVRRDATYTLRFCRVRGHVRNSMPSDTSLDEIDAFVWDGLMCESRYSDLSDQVALEHVDVYFRAVRKLDDDSGLTIKKGGANPYWDLANRRTTWIYGIPFMPNPPPEFLPSTAPYLGSN